jgi:hypothetical protein
MNSSQYSTVKKDREMSNKHILKVELDILVKLSPQIEKIPSTKQQITNNIQIPISNDPNTFGI